MTGQQILDLLGWRGSSFNAKLFRLIAHADSVNREKLRLAFPEEVAAYEAYLENANDEGEGEE